MIRSVLAALLVSTALPIVVHAAEGGAIREITLSSGGVAEVIRSARVDGNDSITIEVPTSQVDDVLKSLLVSDSKGTVSSVSLGGAEPLTETFGKLPFTADDLTDVSRLLTSIQGTNVRATSGGRTVEGRVLGVAAIPGEEGKLDRSLSVLTPAGKIDSVSLAADAGIEILDSDVRDKISKAAETVGAGKAEGARSITIKLKGEGSRDVSLSYVVPASVWKTAYRLVSATDGKARLQAWAVLENSSGEDWSDVKVTLSSGSPVTLSQRLHQRYWRDRPVVPVDATAEAAQPVDRGAVTMAAARQGAQRMLKGQAAPMMEMHVPAPVAHYADLAAATDVVEAEEGLVNASYPLATPVTLAAGATLSLPIIDTDVGAERVSVFRPGTNAIHPVSAMLISNPAEATLPPGIVTVTDGSEGYVGDARLPAVAPGEKRLASFATDRKVTVVTDEKPQSSIAEFSVVDGIMRTSTRNRSVVTYTVTAAAGEVRKVVIEHPKRQGWSFSSESIDGETPDAHRLAVNVKGGETARVIATHELLTSENYHLSEAQFELLSRWSSEATDEKVKSKLADLAAARRAMTVAERDLHEIDAETDRITAEQGRIRENLKAVPTQSELAGTYVARLREQEVELEKNNRRRKEISDNLRKHRASLGEIIRNF